MYHVWYRVCICNFLFISSLPNTPRFFGSHHSFHLYIYLGGTLSRYDRMDRPCCHPRLQS